MREPSFCVSLPKKSYTVKEFNELVYFCQQCVAKLGSSSIRLEMINQDRLFLEGNLKDLSPLAQAYYEDWLKDGRIIKMEVVK